MWPWVIFQHVKVWALFSLASLLRDNPWRQCVQTPWSLGTHKGRSTAGFMLYIPDGISSTAAPVNNLTTNGILIGTLWIWTFQVCCGKCGNGLGHEFLCDGPRGGLSRFWIFSSSLTFIPKKGFCLSQLIQCITHLCLYIIHLWASVCFDLSLLRKGWWTEKWAVKELLNVGTVDEGLWNKDLSRALMDSRLMKQQQYTELLFRSCVSGQNHANSPMQVTVISEVPLGKEYCTAYTHDSQFSTLFAHLSANYPPSPELGNYVEHTESTLL